VEPPCDCAQLQRRCVEQIQWRYELIRPLVLVEGGTATPRAQETHTHPQTVRKLTRHLAQQGLLGLLPNHLDVMPPRRVRQVPEAVVEEIARLKARYAGLHDREVARIVLYKVGYRVDDKTVKALWQQSAPAAQGELALGDYHSHPDPYYARVEVMKLYDPGWNKRRISRFLHISPSMVYLWIARFEAEHFAGLVDHSRAPQAPARKVWLPLMLDVYHLQKRHPDAGEFRIWSLLGNPEISVRTVGRIMALNRQIYEDIPHVRKPRATQDPAPHPYKATAPHEYWCIDGRKMDFALDGVKWWSIMMLDGYSRTMLAGAVAPSEASWVALMVLYTACLRYGAPQTVISDSGGAYISDDFEAVCQRLQIHHERIVSTQGERYKNLMETHFNIQRRLCDDQVSFTTTPAEFEQVHQTFIQTSNTTAHQGLLNDQCDPPIPLKGLGQAKGRLYTSDELMRKCSQALFPRTTNPYGCVTLHSHHCYVEPGVPHTQVLLWVYGEQLRAMLDNVVLAEYHCRYNWRTRKVTEMRDGVFYPTRVASPQGMLIPLTPQESLILYRPTSPRRPAGERVSRQQLLLFELVSPASSESA
jgi:transposase InsO family protein